MTRAGLLALLFLTRWLPALSQDCHCTAPRTCLYNFQKLSLCGQVLDSSEGDRLIKEFTLYSADSILLDQQHNEGASFLLHQTRTMLVITEIELEVKEGKYIYPERYARTAVQLVKGKPLVFNSTVEALPIVARLKKEFKKTTELY